MCPAVSRGRLSGRRGRRRARAPFVRRTVTVLGPSSPCPASTAEGTLLHIELSPRESEVLQLVAPGLPNKRIARELQISEKTVKAHLNQIFRRIGVTDRTQAALWAKERGLA